MLPMPIADFAAISGQLAESGRRVHVMWQTPESLAEALRLGTIEAAVFKAPTRFTLLRELARTYSMITRDVVVTMAAAAGATSRITLSSAVTNPITRHSSVWASAAQSLDELAPAPCAGFESDVGSTR